MKLKELIVGSVGFLSLSFIANVAQAKFENKELYNHCKITGPFSHVAYYHESWNDEYKNKMHLLLVTERNFFFFKKTCADFWIEDHEFFKKDEVDMILFGELTRQEWMDGSFQNKMKFLQKWSEDSKDYEENKSEFDKADKFIKSLDLKLD